MKFYAACIASYNAGHLHGRWIDATDDADEMQGDVDAMLRESPCPNTTVPCPLCGGEKQTIFHNSETGDIRLDTCPTCLGKGEVPSAEEWAAHDYDGLPSSFGEYPSLNDIAEYVALSKEHDHIDADDFTAMFKDFSDVREFDDALRDNFVGIFDTFRDYADEAADESLAAYDIKDDSPLARYFDYESWARDLSMDMRTIDVPGGVAVFYA